MGLYLIFRFINNKPCRWPFDRISIMWKWTNKWKLLESTPPQAPDPGTVVSLKHYSFMALKLKGNRNLNYSIHAAFLWNTWGLHYGRKSYKNEVHLQHQFTKRFLQDLYDGAWTRTDGLYLSLLRVNMWFTCANNEIIASIIP